jgi:hypothetical protein
MAEMRDIMSFPNIPDITPEINITLEEAVNLLLASIAMEEISLSELMDAEKDKILHVINNCKHNDTLLQNAIDIDTSVNTTIQNMIKMQMLLQFKLEKAAEILSFTTTSTTTTSTTTSTTTTHTTTCSTSTCSTTTYCPCRCSLIGNGKGEVSNQSDEFYCQTAFIYALILKGDIQNRLLRYSVQNNDAILKMESHAYNMKVDCPRCLNTNFLIIGGKCHIEKYLKSDCYFNGLANFKLTVIKKSAGKIEFEMQIRSEDRPEFNHYSGCVQIKNSDSDLRIK